MADKRVPDRRPPVEHKDCRHSGLMGKAACRAGRMVAEVGLAG
jgi:hypothetical protein